MQISRDNTYRRVSVGVNVRGRDVESVVKEIQEVLDAKLKLPEGYYVAYGGQFKNLQEAKNRLIIAVPVALLIIFFLLFLTFRSTKEALIIFSAIPLAAIGGILALWMRGMNFSISAGVGFIALFGVAVLNGIVLISYYNRLKEEGEEDITNRILKGSAARLQPVLATAAVASLGFIPMAFSTSAGAEVQKPLATVVIGGLITATFLTLFVLPLLYLIFSGKRKNNVSATTVLVFALLSFNAANAQTPTTKTISVEDAISTALKNNLGIQSQNLNVQSSTTLKKSVFELPKTNVNFQFGQYNSINQDKAFQVSQSIPFPTYFTAKSGLYKAELQSSELRQLDTASEIKAQVQYWFYQLQYLQTTKKQLQSLDSLYNDFVSAATLRYKTGETN